MAAEGWSAENDPSYKELIGSNGSSMVRAKSVGLYENGKLIYGAEPNGKFTGVAEENNGNSGESGIPNGSQNTGSNSSNEVSNSGSDDSSKTEQKPSSSKGGLDIVDMLCLVPLKNTRILRALIVVERYRNVRSGLSRRVKLRQIDKIPAELPPPYFIRSACGRSRRFGRLYGFGERLQQERGGMRL